MDPEHEPGDLPCLADEAAQTVMQLKNCTPHALNIVGCQGDVTTLIPSGIVPRVSVTTIEVAAVGDIPLLRSIPSGLTGLPEPEEGVLLIVSALVRLACPDRHDLASPGELLRDDNGQPIGCKGLVIN